MLVLQATDSLHILPSSSSETFPTSSDGAYNFSNIKVGENVDVKEEVFIAVDEDANIGIKQEESPEDITFPDIKAESGEVSNVCICLYGHILPVSINARCVCDGSSSGHWKQLHCRE
jgi:hypothetical protein